MIQIETETETETETPETEKPGRRMTSEGGGGQKVPHFLTSNQPRYCRLPKSDTIKRRKDVAAEQPKINHARLRVERMIRAVTVLGPAGVT
jgi:hypothetical protein